MISSDMINNAVVCSEITEIPVFSHETFGERFYIFNARCMRLSGKSDVLPCIIHERLSANIEKSERYVLIGQLRSHNSSVDGKNRLNINIYVKSISDKVVDDTVNEITLRGYLCKKPVYRRTPLGREITDMLIAVNRPFGKSDYIPVITWGINARRSAEYNVGEKLYIEGRLQSREYDKYINETEIETRTAYEVSAYAVKRY